MRWSDFEHVIAAAANVTGEEELVVIGSQAILGSHPDAPAELLRSMEADLYPATRPERADWIDGALGDGSQFHRGHSASTPMASVRRPRSPRRGGAIGWCASRCAPGPVPVGARSRSASSLTISSSPSAWPVGRGTGNSPAMRCSA